LIRHKKIKTKHREAEEENEIEKHRAIPAGIPDFGNHHQGVFMKYYDPCSPSSYKHTRIGEPSLE